MSTTDDLRALSASDLLAGFAGVEPCSPLRTSGVFIKARMSVELLCNKIVSLQLV